MSERVIDRSDEAFRTIIGMIDAAIESNRKPRFNSVCDCGTPCNGAYCPKCIEEENKGE